jgi:hypothetical protein
MGDEVDCDCLGFFGALLFASLVESIHFVEHGAVDGLAILVDGGLRHDYNGQIEIEKGR